MIAQLNINELLISPSAHSHRNGHSYFMTQLVALHPGEQWRRQTFFSACAMRELGVLVRVL